MCWVLIAMGPKRGFSEYEWARATSWRDQEAGSDEDEEAGIVGLGRRGWFPGPKRKAVLRELQVKWHPDRQYGDDRRCAKAGLRQ